jgi:transglutaminase-like putative cysteine protease
MGDGIQRFGWHAWAEVDLDGRWVQVDPSWGEPLANATHLTLGVGDEADWVAALGGLDIKLAEPR